MLERIQWISPVGWYHLCAFGLLIPALAVRSLRIVRKAPQALPDRARHFRATAVTLALFGAFSLFTAWQQRMDLFATDWGAVLRASPFAIAAYAAAVLFMRPRWRKAVIERKPIVRLFMPSTPGERVWWIAVALLAGIGEEITWRGVQTRLLTSLCGSVTVAILLCAVQFGVAHAVQGWKSSLYIVGFALGFQALVLVSGSLFLAMAVHVAYDVTAGIQYGRLGRELGYDAPAETAT